LFWVHKAEVTITGNSVVIVVDCLLSSVLEKSDYESSVEKNSFAVEWINDFSGMST
jgi:hypothetical protein